MRCKNSCHQRITFVYNLYTKHNDFNYLILDTNRCNIYMTQVLITSMTLKNFDVL